MSCCFEFSETGNMIFQQPTELHTCMNVLEDDIKADV